MAQSEFYNHHARQLRKLVLLYSNLSFRGEKIVLYWFVRAVKDIVDFTLVSKSNAKYEY